GATAYSPFGSRLRTLHPTPVGVSPLNVRPRSRRKQPAGAGAVGESPGGGGLVAVAIGKNIATSSSDVGVRCTHSTASWAPREAVTGSRSHETRTVSRQGRSGSVGGTSPSRLPATPVGEGIDECGSAGGAYAASSAGPVCGNRRSAYVAVTRKSEFPTAIWPGSRGSTEYDDPKPVARLRNGSVSAGSMSRDHGRRSTFVSSDEVRPSCCGPATTCRPVTDACRYSRRPAS